MAALVLPPTMASGFYTTKDYLLANLVHSTHSHARWAKACTLGGTVSRARVAKVQRSPSENDHLPMVVSSPVTWKVAISAEVIRRSRVTQTSLYKFIVNGGKCNIHTLHSLTDSYAVRGGPALCTRHTKVVGAQSNYPSAG